MGDKLNTQYVIEAPVNRKQITESGLWKKKTEEGGRLGRKYKGWGGERILNIFSTDAS